MTDKHPQPDPKPRLKTYRKTKWFYGILLTYYIVTISAGAWWWSYSHKLYNEAVDPVIARGEPLAWSDFASDSIPDNENAAVLYEQVGDCPMVKDSPQLYLQEFSHVRDDWISSCREMVAEFVSKPEIRRKYPKEVRKVIELSRGALALCRKARLLGKADWKISPDNEDSGSYTLLIPGRGSSVARLLCLAAIDAHQRGRDDAAVEYLRDIIAMGDAMSTIPSDMAVLQSSYLYSSVKNPLEQILPGLRIGQAPGNVRTENLRGLIAELLDTSKCSQGVALAMMGERCTSYEAGQIAISMGEIGGLLSLSRIGDLFVTFRSDDIVRRSQDFCLAPVWRIDSARAMIRWNAFVAASDAPAWPEFKRRAMHTDHDCDDQYFPRMLACYRMSTVGSYHYYAAMADRRMSATAIAVGMYQTHTGHRPGSLADLVPDYLSGVPFDPMAEPKTPIRYVSEQHVPRIYSIGWDGQDDGGDLSEFRGESDVRKDTFFFLDGRPSRPEEAGDDDDGDE